MRTRVSVFVFALVLAVAASTVVAEEVSGHNIVVQDPPVITELPNGSSYAVVNGRQVCTMSDSEHPLNRASGICAGGCIVDDKGNMTCKGSCSWVAQSGELVFFVWDGSETEGHWWLQGGTGAYENASGEGTWKTDATYAGGIIGNSWTGVINLK